MQVVLVEFDPDFVVGFAVEVGGGAGDEDEVAEFEVNEGDVAGRFDGVDAGGKGGRGWSPMDGDIAVADTEDDVTVTLQGLFGATVGERERPAVVALDRD